MKREGSQSEDKKHLQKEVLQKRSHRVNSSGLVFINEEFQRRLLAEYL